jgi:hypothetical protein
MNRRIWVVKVEDRIPSVEDRNDIRKQETIHVFENMQDAYSLAAKILELVFKTKYREDALPRKGLSDRDRYIALDVFLVEMGETIRIDIFETELK